MERGQRPAPLFILLRLGLDVGALVAELHTLSPTILRLEMSKYGVVTPVDYSPDDWSYLFDYIGIPYHWGKGDLHTSIEMARKLGLDCGALVLLAIADGAGRGLVQLRTDLVDMSSGYMLERSTKVLDPADIRAGDLVGYSGHVGMVIRPRVGASPMMIGANGGGSSTRGKTDTACVQIRPGNYRSDYHGVYRPYSSLWVYADGRWQK